jgi:hypothetical protein
MTEAEEKQAEGYSNYRWKRCASNGRVLIKAFIEKSSTWETIIEVHASTDVGAEKLSDYIWAWSFKTRRGWRYLRKRVLRSSWSLKRALPFRRNTRSIGY